MKESEQIEAEALYFRMYHSYLLQQPGLREDYDMLLDHYRRHPDSFKGLSRNDVLRIKQVQDDIINNRHTLFSSGLDLSSDIPTVLKKEKTDKDHRTMCNEILRNRKALLEPFTGPISNMNREHPSLYGPIDIVVQSGSCVYVVEVKTCPADHAIVGQVMKYYIGMSLKLILRVFDEVKIVCVCPSYDENSFKGLKRIGALPLVISPNLKKTSTL